MDDLRQRVYRSFDPKPIRPDQAADKDLYVSLDEVRGSTGIVTRLADAVRLSSRPTHQLLAGHAGSGKSTELRRLQGLLEGENSRYFVVFCEIERDIDRYDVDFPDVLIAIMRQLADQFAERLKIALQPGLLKGPFERVWDSVKSLRLEELKFGAGLPQGLANLSAVMKGSPVARSEIRKALEPDTSNLLVAANDVIGKAALEASKKGFPGLVVIVDDLDKIAPRRLESSTELPGEDLFVTRHAQLTGFQCHMVYTMPLALAYSPAEKKICSAYGIGNIPVVPMTRLKERPPGAKPYKRGIQKFGEIVTRRLEKANAGESDVFHKDVLDRVIALSGGQPRELMVLVREAIIGGEVPISLDALERVARGYRHAYGRQLLEEHWPFIRQVARTGELDRSEKNEQIIFDLLDSRAVLQYSNGGDWYGVNPLVPEPPGKQKSSKVPRGRKSTLPKKKK